MFNRKKFFGIYLLISLCCLSLISCQNSYNLEGNSATFNPTPQNIPTIQTITPEENSVTFTPIPQNTLAVQTITSIEPPILLNASEGQQLIEGFIVAHPYFYSWFKLIPSENQSYIKWDSEDSFHQTIITSTMVKPPDFMTTVFSNYSDQIAFTFSTTSTLFLSNIYHQNITTLTNDKNYKVVGWTENDLYLFLINTDSRQKYLYSLQNSELFEWPFDCKAVIISPISNKLVPMCTKKASAPIEIDPYALLEWTGEINYYKEITNKPFLIVQPDEEIFWEWSPFGEFLAFFDPNDEKGHLNIANSQGTIIHKILAGSSVFSEPLNQTEKFLPLSTGENLFVWSFDMKTLLIKGYGNSCPPYANEFNPDILINKWPCWQVVNLDSGQIIWSEIDFVQNTNDIRYPGIPVNIWDIKISPTGQSLAIFTSDPHHIYFVDLKNNSVVLLKDSLSSSVKIYWGSKFLGEFE